VNLKLNSMAKITPYADINAHGSIGDSVTFRRRYGSVILQKKSNPKQPNSASQLAQRSAFKTASEDWYGYDAQSKPYYNLRGPELEMTGQNLYIQASLLNNLPSLTAMQIKQLIDCQISTPRGSATDNIYWSFWSDAQADLFGEMFDTENSFMAGSTLSTAKNFMITIERNDAPDINYLFRDSLWIKVKLGDDSIVEYLLRFPAFIGSASAVSFWISADGSVFIDSARSHLGATNNF